MKLNEEKLKTIFACILVICLFAKMTSKTVGPKRPKGPKSIKKDGMKVLPKDNIGKDKKNGMDICVYGYDGCGYTRKLKEELKTKNIKFDYRQIDKNPEYNEEYKKYGKKGVPLTVNLSNGKSVVGYNTAENIIEKIK
tara:strand:+ start:24 stop:437 length:414 start_codon:yes stop_codon:yes gene_type:complete